MKDESNNKAAAITDAVYDRTWHERLLPLMVFMAVGMTVFFLIASMVQLNSLNVAIQNAPELDLSTLIQSPSKTVNERIDAHQRALLALEANVIDRRHHEASVALMARIWTRYMGFITGMTLSMVGAVFILGRLNTSTSALSGEMGKASFQLQSASPGLFMIVLGTAMMIVTITNHPRINVVDKAVFVAPMEGVTKFDESGLGTAAGTPPALPNWPMESNEPGQ